MLHTINKSPFEKNLLSSCLKVIDDDSVVLFIEDGVIGATKNNKSVSLAALRSEGRVFALQNDLEARGLSSKVLDDIKLVDYKDFVNLVVEHGTPVSWL